MSLKKFQVIWQPYLTQMRQPPQSIHPRLLSCICVFFLFTAMHVKSLAFCVREWRRYTIQQSQTRSLSLAQFSTCRYPCALGCAK